jgi:hypothetical protein
LNDNKVCCAPIKTNNDTNNKRKKCDKHNGTRESITECIFYEFLKMVCQPIIAGQAREILIEYLPKVLTELVVPQIIDDNVNVVKNYPSYGSLNFSMRLMIAELYAIRCNDHKSHYDDDCDCVEA